MATALVGQSLNDLKMAKLSARYPTLPKNLSFLLRKYETDNASFGFENTGKNRGHISATTSETTADAEARFWTAFVP